jgi:hypothetical protein
MRFLKWMTTAMLVGTACGAYLDHRLEFLPHLDLAFRGYCPDRDIAKTLYYKPCVNDGEVTAKLQAGMQEYYIEQDRIAQLIERDEATRQPKKRKP